MFWDLKMDHTAENGEHIAENGEQGVTAERVRKIAGELGILNSEFIDILKL